jgi:hypothetical protein
MSHIVDFLFELQKCPDEHSVFACLMTRVMERFGAVAVDCQTHDAKKDMLRVVAAVGWPADVLENMRLLPLTSGTVCSRAASSLHTVTVNDVFADESFRPFRHVAERVGFKSVQSVPLLNNAGALQGVCSLLFVGSDPTDTSLAELYVRLASNAIEQLRNLHF